MRLLQSPYQIYRRIDDGLSMQGLDNCKGVVGYVQLQLLLGASLDSRRSCCSRLHGPHLTVLKRRIPGSMLHATLALVFFNRAPGYS